MADNTIVEKVRIEGDSSDARKAYKDLEKQIAKSAKSNAIATAAFTKALGIGTAAARSMFGELKKGVQANLEFQRTTVSLTRALTDSGHEVTENLRTLQFLSAQMESLTGVNDETIRSMQTLAINMGVGADRAHEFTKAAMRLSRATGMELESAMRNLVKSTGGLAGELGEAIPAIRNLTTEELKAGGAIRLVNEMWASQLELADNTDGQLTRLSTSWDSFTEAITASTVQSGLLSDVFKNISDTLDDITTLFNERGLEAGLNAMITKFSALFGLLNPVTGIVGSMRELAGLATGETVAYDATMARADAAMRLDPLTGKPGSSGGGGGGAKKAGRGGRGSGHGGRGGDQPSITIGNLEVGSGIDMEGWDKAFGDALEEQKITQEQWVDDVNEMRLQRERDVLDAKRALWQDQLDWETEQKHKQMYDQQLAQQEHDRAWADASEQVFQHVSNIATDAIMTSLNALYDMADGQSVIWEEVAKAFLKSTGFQLVAQATKHGFDAIAAYIGGHYETGAAMTALAAGEAAAGAAMIGGSLAIKPPGSGSGKVSDISGANGAGGSTGGRGSGTVQENIYVTVNQTGNVGPDSAGRLSTDIESARRRGFNS